MTRNDAGRRNRRVFLWLVLALLALGLALSWFAGSVMVEATPSLVAPARPPAQDLKIVSTDDVTLAASYWPGRTAQAPAVLLLHGNGASRAMMAANAAWLAAEGYAALTIDFRGHGESTATPHSFGLRESADVAAALAWLKRRQGGAPVAVIGVSLGGAAALLGSQDPLAANALILQAVYPDIRRAIRNRLAAQTGSGPAWLLEPLLSLQALPRYGEWPSRIAPLAALRRYHGPVFVIGGGADRYTPPNETRELFEAAPGPRALWIVDGLDHRRVSGLTSDLYRARVLAFLRRSIGNP
ncbi:alpha/beta fold hydrolase [Sphingomonas sp. JC676]|uniref:alpha/beta hydrolase n=1 Tax=Sphingomonas sp. JC676 TaxID=2768065 RepID=UPI00165858D7|nr:alpha/beta fold hydrolase [Sphingomonas sp. JC676]MBC9031773.1 alpha/beta fold hydrolase [Sphingomonas sp. JC676]